MRRGAMILCGGKSSRMGRDKGALPFGPEQMLQRIVRLMCEVVDAPNIVVVAAPGRSLPALPASVTIAQDRQAYQGPLEGLATGFRALGDGVDAAYATGCDVPLLAPAFVNQMFNSLGEYDIAVPRDGEYYYPLAAVYRPKVLPKIDALLAAGRLRPRFLFDEAPTNEINVDDLRRVDPQLLTLKNLNSPEEYSSALAAAGFATPVDA